MLNFLKAARAKKLDRVAAAYAVATWLLVQAAAIAFPSFAVPIWALRAVIALAVVGFPVALFIAWFSIPHPHPEEIATHGGLAAGEIALLALLGTVIALSLVQFAYQFRGSRTQISPSASVTQAQTGPPQTSVAVLPFENLSSDKEAAYFTAGIQDEILTRLTKIGALKVISRTSTTHFASKPDNLPEIAKELGVANVLEGSVQKIGRAVHINVQLIRASTDDHLWAEIYDRKLDDVFAVEGEVAAAIADALNARITGAERQAITAKPTNNPEAYDAYLRGLAFLHKFGLYNRAAALPMEEAVRLDPKFALAWAQLSRIDAAMYYSGSDATDARRSAARSAFEAALRLKPDLAEARVAQAFYLYWIEHDYAGAERILAQLRGEWPNNAEVAYGLALLARRLGKWDQSVSNFEQAIALDPLLPVYRGELARTLTLLRREQDALPVLDAALGKWPDNRYLATQKAVIYQRLGKLAEADALITNLRPQLGDSDLTDAIASQALLQRRYSRAIEIFKGLLAADSARQVSSALSLVLQDLGDVQRASGDTNGAKASYEQSRDGLLREVRTARRHDLLFYLAWAFCGLGDRDAAMNYADQAVRELSASKDALSAMEAETVRAKIEARFGDKDRAIPALERLLKSPGLLTPSLLRLDPDFDKLRGDPRFEALTK